MSESSNNAGVCSASEGGGAAPIPARESSFWG